MYLLIHVPNWKTNCHLSSPIFCHFDKDVPFRKIKSRLQDSPTCSLTPRNRLHCNHCMMIILMSVYSSLLDSLRCSSEAFKTSRYNCCNKNENTEVMKAFYDGHNKTCTVGALNFYRGFNLYVPMIFLEDLCRCV